MGELIVLDKKIVTAAMTDRTSNPQVMYTYQIEGNSLVAGNTIRVRATLARTVGPPACVIEAPPAEEGMSCGHTCPFGQYAQAVYGGSAVPGGPIIRVDPLSNSTAYYGLQALYVPLQGGIALVLWNGENLNGIGTILTTTLVTLVNGDVLRIEADTISETLYLVKVNGVTVISYTVDNATLPVIRSCVDFRESTGIPDGAVVAAPAVDGLVQSCVDTFALANPYDFVMNVDGEHFDANGVDLQIKSGEGGSSCYGFYYMKGYVAPPGDTSSGPGSYIEFQAVYGGNISGSPISGVCWKINESSTPTNFTGWVVLINEKAGKIQVGYYVNESLASLPSNILYELADTFPAGTLVWVAMTSPKDLLPADGWWVVDVFTQKPSSAWVHHYNTSTDPPVAVIPNGAQDDPPRMINTNAGVIVVGNGDAGIHKARWNGPGTPDGDFTSWYGYFF